MPLTVMPTTLPDAVKGEHFQCLLVADGGIPPYSFSHEAGAPGVSILSTGQIDGIPQLEAGEEFKVSGTVTDSSVPAQKADFSFDVKVVPPDNA